jgi:hypothetical protein
MASAKTLSALGLPSEAPKACAPPSSRSPCGLGVGPELRRSPIPESDSGDA